MNRLHIYNLDHDYALADGSHNFTPPLKIRRMRNLYSLFPALYADEGDYILYLDSDANSLPEKDADWIKGYNVFKSLIRLKNLHIIKLTDLSKLDFSSIEIQPWGWNNTLLYKLIQYGVPSKYLPMPVYIDRIRKLSHRANSIQFLETVINFANRIKYTSEATILLRAFNKVEIPTEVKETDAIIPLLNKYGNIYLKAPWSSSGRGVMFSKGLSHDQILQWAHGVIRKQGSLIIEKAYTKKADFATEWALVGGNPLFLGFSTFETSPRGKFKVNKFGTLEQLDIMPLELITSKTDYSYFEADIILSRILEAQVIAIKETYSNFFQTSDNILYLGIDMLIGEDNIINPCVEVNLRTTMGHIALIVSEQISETFNTELKDEMLKFVADNGLKLPEIV